MFFLDYHIESAACIKVRISALIHGIHHRLPRMDWRVQRYRIKTLADILETIGLDDLRLHLVGLAILLGTAKRPPVLIRIGDLLAIHLAHHNPNPAIAAPQIQKTPGSLWHRVQQEGGGLIHMAWRKHPRVAGKHKFFRAKIIRKRLNIRWQRIILYKIMAQLIPHI